MILFTDSREQDFLEFGKVEGVEHRKSCLSVGDYTASYVVGGKTVESRFVVERKGMGDLFNSYTSGYERERAKFKRSEESEKTFILAVEGTVNDILQGFSYTKHGVEIKHKKDGISMLRQLMTCAVKYGVQLWWFRSRYEMAMAVQELFLAEERFLENAATSAAKTQPLEAGV